MELNGRDFVAKNQDSIFTTYETIKILNRYRKACYKWASDKYISNKNGVLWSQTCMRIEMRLRCFWSFSNW